MIICSVRDLKIGQREKGLWNIGDWHPEQPFVILRTATFDEWLADCIKDAGRKPPSWVIRDAQTPQTKFYEISLD